MRALITGFDPFGGASLNPSGEIVARLADAPPNDAFGHFEFLVLPTVYETAVSLAIAAMAQYRPDLVVMFGLSSAARTFCLERFALNVADCAKPDNDGCTRSGSPIAADGPAACSTGLDLTAIVSAFDESEAHAPVISNHAGTFVCNFLYYSVLRDIAERGADTQALFVHVPWSLPVNSAEDLACAAIDLHVACARRLLRVLRNTMIMRPDQRQ